MYLSTADYAHSPADEYQLKEHFAHVGKMVLLDCYLQPTCNNEQVLLQVEHFLIQTGKKPFEMCRNLI